MWNWLLFRETSRQMQIIIELYVTVQVQPAFFFRAHSLKKKLCIFHTASSCLKLSKVCMGTMGTMGTRKPIWYLDWILFFCKYIYIYNKYIFNFFVYCVVTHRLTPFRAYMDILLHPVYIFYIGSIMHLRVHFVIFFNKKWLNLPFYQI